MAKRKTPRPLSIRAREQGIKIRTIPKKVLLRSARESKEFLRVQNARRKKLGLKPIKF